jgi:hypothetical protein
VKDLEGGGPWRNGGIIYLEGHKSIIKILAGITSISAEIRTHHVPNTRSGSGFQSVPLRKNITSRLQSPTGSLFTVKSKTKLLYDWRSVSMSWY